MKKQEKRMIYVLLVIAVVVIGGLLLWKNMLDNRILEQPLNENKKIEENKEKEKYVTVLEDGTKLNNSTKLKETKQFEGMEITKIQLTYKKGQSILLANVENKTKKDIETMPIQIILYDENKNEIDRLNGAISAIKEGESTQLNIGTQNNCVNAYDFEIVKK